MLTMGAVVGAFVLRTGALEGGLLGLVEGCRVLTIGALEGELLLSLIHI